MQLEGPEPWEGAGVWSELLEGTGPGGARQAVDNATGQGGLVVLAVLVRFGCLVPCGTLSTAGQPRALQLESAARGREEQGGSGRLPQHLPLARRSGRAAGGSGCQPVPKQPGSRFVPADTIGRAPARARGTRIGWPRLALSGGFPAAVVSARPCAADRVTAPPQRPGHALFSRCATVDVGGEELSPAPAGAAGPCSARAGAGAVNQPEDEQDASGSRRKPPGGTWLQECFI